MTTFPERLKALHSRTPERVAVYLQFSTRDDLPITYTQLLHGSASYAQALTYKGIQPGEVVVLILQHGEDLLYAFWGAILHGAIPSIMPFLTEKLSPERYRADLSALISVTKPAAIVTYPEFENDVRGALVNGDSVRKVIVTNEVDSPQSSAVDFDILSGFQRKPDDIVLLQHSSGTTGLQKGVALSHQSVFNQLNAYSRSLSLNENDVIVSWLPLYHDMGLIAGFLMPILSGVPLVLMSPFDWVRAPYRLMHSVTKYRGTLSWLPNFAYNFCAQKIRDRHLEGVDLLRWRAVINCSEPVRWESHQAFYERFKGFGLTLESLQSSYAMAENVFSVTQSSLGSIPVVDEIDRESFMVERVAKSLLDGRPSMKMMSSGHPLENVNVRILDENGKEVSDRVIGEVALKSDCMLTGYYNRDDLTHKALVDGWYLTGDYGYISDGEVFVSGRKKDMIIVGGKNVYPQDLESLTYEVPGVHAGRSVAFGMFDESQGTEDVVIIAEVDSDDEGEQQKIADAIRLHVTKNSAIALRYVKVVGPKWIVKTSSGKTARSANKEKFLARLQNGVKTRVSMASSDLLRQAVDAARAGRRMDARTMLLELVEHDPRNEMAWMWLSGLVDDLEDRIIACENVLTINPANERVRQYLAELHRQKAQHVLVDQQKTAQINHFDQKMESVAVVAPSVMKVEKKGDPLLVAEQLELEGKYAEALEIYKVQAGTTKDLDVFDHIYKRIVHIEKMQDEKIHHVAPGLSIARLTFTWPLLYLSLAFVQVGLNPFAHPAAYLWLGFPFVMLGGFLLAISETRQGNLIMKKMVLEDVNEIGFMRTVTASAGWMMIVVPMILIVLDSIHRLAIFQVPPRLFP